MAIAPLANSAPHRMPWKTRTTPRESSGRETPGSARCSRAVPVSRVRNRRDRTPLRTCAIPGAAFSITQMIGGP